MYFSQLHTSCSFKCGRSVSPKLENVLWFNEEEERSRGTKIANIRWRILRQMTEIVLLKVLKTAYDWHMSLQNFNLTGKKPVTEGHNRCGTLNNMITVETVKESWKLWQS